MNIIEIKILSNGGHNNQSWLEGYDLPEGYAVVPEAMETPNFPFGEITTKEIDGVPTVTSWKPLPIPEPEPLPDPEPTDTDILKSQVTYTALKTNTIVKPNAGVMMMSLDQTSPMYNDIEQWYKWGLWTSEMVQEAVPSLIMQDEANAILEVQEKEVVKNG